MIKSRGNTHYIIRSRRFIMPALRGQALNIATALAVLALIAVVAMISWLSMTSPAAVEIQRQQQEYFRSLEREQSDPAAVRAWKRLHRKHGEPGVVIYEPGQKPWYVNKAGKKCQFI